MLLVVAVEAENRWVWAICLLQVAAISLFAWIGNMRRSRAIVDTPTSSIASAAQGYAELTGRALWPEDTPLLSELRQTPCCWYWFRIEKRNSKNNWVLEREGESDAPFLLVDSSGTCIVHPAEAELHSSRRETWRAGDKRHTEMTIQPGDPLYAIGDFSTLRPLQGPAAVNAEIGRLLASWKLDPMLLRERFDLNRDGNIDLTEWALARSQARREARARLVQAAAAPAVHLLRRPADDRRFLLSNMSPEKLARKYLLWKWLHLTLFFVGLGIGTSLLAG